MMADCQSYTTDEMVAHFKAGFHGSTLNDDQVRHGLDAVFLARGLFDGSAPMADGGAVTMTAAEEVLAYLLVEKVGAPDDAGYSPDDAQKIIEQRLSPDPDITALQARVKELEEGLAPFAKVAEMEAREEAGASVMVNVNRCRDAAALLKGAAS